MNCCSLGTERVDVHCDEVTNDRPCFAIVTLHSLLPARIATAITGATPCEKSAALLKRFDEECSLKMRPLAVLEDGNCMFRAVSLALYNTEDHYRLLRAMTLHEILAHRDFYDKNSDSFCFREDNFIESPAFSDLCKEVATNGSNCCILALQALSAVCRVPIIYYVPGEHNSECLKALNRKLRGRDSADDNAAAITIMFSSTDEVGAEGVYPTPNHFVPLVPIAEEAADGPQAHE